MKKIALLLLAGISLPASASLITSYDTRAAFNAAVSGITTMNFNGLAVGGSKNYGISLNTAGLSFSEKDPNLVVLSGGAYGDPFTSDYLNNNGGASEIRITFSRPVYGFALDFGSILNWGLASGNPTETFTFAGSSETYNLPGYLYHYTSHTGVPLSFAGFTSDTPFTQIVIADPTQGLALDNFSYTFGPAIAPPTEPGSPVPEPGSAALFALGLLGVGAASRRHTNASES